MKYCMKCGTPSADEMLFCSACGFEFPVEAQQEAVPVKNEYESVAPQYVPVMQSQTEQPDETQQFYYAQQPAYMNTQEDIASPVPKKRKVWLWSLLSVVLVVALGASAWYFLLRERNDTKATISEAVFASVEDLEDLYDDSANFDAFVDALRDFDTSEMRLTLEMESGSDAFADDDTIDKMRVIMENNRSEQAQLSSGKLTFELSKDENKANFDLIYAMNEDMTQFTLPGLLDDVYCVKENIFEDLGLDPIESVMQSENTPSMSEAREIFDRLVDSIQSETITEKTFALSGKRVVCEIHTITYDQAIADELTDYLLGETKALLEESEIKLPKMENIQLIVRNDACIGIIFDSQTDDEVTNYQLILGGDKNPWSDIYCYTDGEETLHICTTINEDGFVVESTGEGETAKLTLIDSERKLIIEAADEDPEEIYFGVEDGKISLATEMEEFNLTVSVEVLTQLPTMLSENSIDVNELDDDELMDLLAKISTAIKDNPDFAWLVEDSYAY